MSGFPGVTEADISKLQEYIDNNNRAGFYLQLYELTGSQQALIQAQISTFSGLAGGTAFSANAQLIQQLGSSYPFGGDVNKFSVDVAQTTLNEIKLALSDPENLGVVNFSDTDILAAAQEAWNTQGIGKYFPGILFEGLSRANLAAPGTSATLENLVSAMLLGAGAADYSDSSLYTPHSLMNPDGSVELTYYTDSTGRTVYVGDYSAGLLGATISIGDALTGPNSLSIAVVGVLRDLPGMSNLRRSLEQSGPPQTVSLFGTNYTANQLEATLRAPNALGGLTTAVLLGAVQTVETVPTSATLDFLQKAIINLINSIANVVAASIDITRFLQQALANPVNADMQYYAVINKYLITQGYYVPQPNDGTTIGDITDSIVVQLAANGISITAQTLGQINSVFADSNFSLGGLSYVPISVSSISPTAAELPVLRSGRTDVFDPGTGKLYTMAAGLDGSNVGQFIVDTTGFEVAVNTIQDVYASSTSLTLVLANGDDGLTSVTLDNSDRTAKFVAAELGSDMVFDPASGNITSVNTVAGVGLASSLQFNFSEQVDGHALAVLCEADGADSVGIDPDSSFTPVVDFALGGSDGDTIDVSDNDKTTVIDTEIGDNAAAVISNDFAVAGISDTYTFMSNDGTLILDNPVGFLGTIDGFVLGDIIDLEGVFFTGATITAGDVLVALDDGSPVASIQLSPSQDYSSDTPVATYIDTGGDAIALTTAPMESDAQTATVEDPVTTYPDGIPTTTTYTATVNFSSTDVLLPAARAEQTDIPGEEPGTITVTYAGGIPDPEEPGAGVDVSGGSSEDFSAGSIYDLGPSSSDTLEVQPSFTPGDYSNETLPVSVNYLGNSTTIDLAVSQKIYEPASAAFSVNGGPDPLPFYNFGVVHIGQSASIDVEITNAAVGALTDNLVSSPGSFGEFTAENGVDLAAGDVGTVTVSMDADISGIAYSEPALFDLVSHDSDLPDEAASSTNANLLLQADVYNYAQPTLVDGDDGIVDGEPGVIPSTEPGAGVLTQTGNESWNLDFGTINNTDTTGYFANVVALNAAPDSIWSDELSGSFESSGDGFFYSVTTTTPGAAVAGVGLELGDFDPDLTNLGTHTVTVVYSPTSVDSAGTTALSDITLTVTDNIVPPAIPGATLVGQGDTVIATIDAGQDSVIDPLFASGLVDTLIIQGPGVAEIDDVDFISNLEIAADGTLLLAGGAIYTDPVTIDPGGNIVGFGTIAGSEAANGIITAEGGTLDITGDINGSGTLTFAPGGSLLLEGTVVATESLIFNGGSGVLILGTSAVLYGTINDFVSGDQIIVDTTAAAVFNLSGSVVSVIENGTTVGVLGFDTVPAAASAFVTPDALVDNVLCFLAGTLIETPAGQTEVGRLAVGDLVRTASGAVQPVNWIGHGRVLATRGRRTAATPVIVRKGALADNVPHQDLRVTKGHSLFFNGALIPVEFLVNHRSILWDDRAQEVTVYHIELETHDVLIANGAPAESYRDDGNRWLFQNANSGWHLPPKPSYAPVLTGGPIVDAVWRRVLDRAGPRPGVPLTDDPDLHLLVDGTRLDAGMQTGDFYIFNVSHASAEIRIVSRAAVPQELGLARDPRCLGVAVRRMVVRQKTQFRKFEADDALLQDGFHAFEADNGFRWTDGDAGLPPEMFAGLAGPVEVVLHIGAITQYIEGIAATRAA